MSTIFKHLLEEIKSDFQEIKKELGNDSTNSLVYFKALIYTSVHLIKKPVELIKDVNELFKTQKVLNDLDKLNIHDSICYFFKANDKNNLTALIYGNKKVVFFELKQAQEKSICLLSRLFENPEELYLTINFIKALKKSMKSPKKVSEVLDVLNQYDTNQIRGVIDEMTIYSEQNLLNDSMSNKIAEKKHKNKL
jgi:hypothetical protein